MLKNQKSFVGFQSPYQWIGSENHRKTIDFPMIFPWGSGSSLEAIQLYDELTVLDQAWMSSPSLLVGREW